MLTPTRKPEETIIIGEGSEQIEITVKEIRRNQVRLGISAPDNMRIYRKELLVRDAARENMESDAEGGADARE